MSTEWAVTTERLNDSAAFIEEKAAKYNEEWAKLYAELESLKSSKWKGIASDMFNDRLEGYRADFQEMSKVVEAYAAYLRSAAENYAQTEDSLKEAASSLNAGN